MFSGHNGIKLEINDRERAGKSSHILKLSNTLLNNTSIKKRSQEKLSFQLDENEYINDQN